MIALILSDIPSVWTHHKPQQGSDTYTIDIARRRPPLRIPITTIRDPREAARHIIVQGRILPEVQFVAIPMAVRASCIACLGAACDRHVTAASASQSDGTVNGAREDAFVGGAAWVRLGCAAA